MHTRTSLGASALHLLHASSALAVAGLKTCCGCSAPAPGAALQVATRRTRTAGKADIPSVDDPIAKLDHMGKETIKKLQVNQNPGP